MSSRQPVDVEYEDALDEAAQEWRRVPIVRYDTAHGYAHRDQMFRDRESIKTRLGDRLSFDEALQIADDDVRRHWRTYRRQFMRNQP